MVTRIPARRPEPGAEVRELLVRILGDGPEVARALCAPPVELRQRADRLLAALAAAGLVVTPDAEVRLPA